MNREDVKGSLNINVGFGVFSTGQESVSDSSVSRRRHSSLRQNESGLDRRDVEVGLTAPVSRNRPVVGHVPVLLDL